MISQDALKALLDGKVIRRTDDSPLAFRNMQWKDMPSGKLEIGCDDPAGGKMHIQNSETVLILLQDEWEPVPPKLMNWAKARAAMESGKKVNRLEWAPSCSLIIEGEEFRDNYGYVATLRPKDLDATDWYVVD